MFSNSGHFYGVHTSFTIVFVIYQSALLLLKSALAAEYDFVFTKGSSQSMRFSTSNSPGCMKSTTFVDLSVPLTKASLIIRR